MKKQALLSAALTVGMLGMTVTPAFAAGNGGNVNVDIQAKATTVNVTVSDTAAFVFNEDGTNTTPSNFTVTNNSEIAGLHLVSANFTQEADKGWTIEDQNYSFKTMAKDTKKVALQLGAEGKLKDVIKGTDGKTGKATFGANDFQLPAKTSKTVKFGVKRGAFSQAVANETAFKMVMNYEFD